MPPRLPVKPGPCRSLEPGAELRRVLLVDDEPDAVYLFARLLVQAGIKNQFDVAHGGEDAIDYFEACQSGQEPWPSAVFLDIKMPNITGFDVLAWLKARQLLNHTVLVMLTSSDEPEDVQRALALGAHFYLPKDARPELLHELLRTAMRQADLGPKLEILAR